MKNADAIVKKLLESSTNGTTLCFGPGEAAYGGEYMTFGEAIGSREDDEEALQRRLQGGYVLIRQISPGSLQVYGLKPSIAYARGLVDYVANVFGVDPSTKVRVSSSLEGGESRQVPLSAIFSRKRSATLGETPAAGLAGGIDDTLADTQREQKVQQWSGQPVAYGEKLDFGLEVETETADNNGVVIAGVYPDGPGAKGGIVAGDRIVEIGPVRTERGTFGPYRIRNTQDFENVIRYAQQGYSVPMEVIRRGAKQPVIVLPQAARVAPANTNDITIGAGEARAWNANADEIKRKLSANRDSLYAFTVAELAQILNTTPRIIVTDLQELGITVRDYTPEIPNERDNAQQTGNRRASVSSIT